MLDIWEELRRDRESGARRLVAEYGNRLYAAGPLFPERRFLRTDPGPLRLRPLIARSIVEALMDVTSFEIELSTWQCTRTFRFGFRLFSCWAGSPSSHGRVMCLPTGRRSQRHSASRRSSSAW